MSPSPGQCSKRAAAGAQARPSACDRPRSPPISLGRTNAGYRFTVTGIAAIGALIGGALGALIGPRATMIVGALGTLAAMCFVIRSPNPKLLDLSELEPDGASSEDGASHMRRGSGA